MRNSWYRQAASPSLPLRTVFGGGVCGNTLEKSRVVQFHSFSFQGSGNWWLGGATRRRAKRIIPAHVYRAEGGAAGWKLFRYRLGRSNEIIGVEASSVQSRPRLLVAGRVRSLFQTLLLLRVYVVAEILALCGNPLQHKFFSNTFDYSLFIDVFVPFTSCFV